MTLRVLTVRQPWAWSLIEGGKDVENRSRNIAGSYRGPVAIHAGLARFEDDGLWSVRKAIESLDLGYEASDSQVWAADHVESTDPRFIYGAIIGVVDLVSVHRSRSRGEYGISCFSDELNSWGSVCSEWAEDVSWHLMFTNSRRLETPIPYKGALGIRCLPDEVEARVLAGLQPVTHTGM